MTEWACLLDIKPFLQTASVEEMTAWSDHSTVHVLEGMSTKTHTGCVVKFPLTLVKVKANFTLTVLI